MKITKKQLRKIIKEELGKVIEGTYTAASGLEYSDTDRHGWGRLDRAHGTEDPVDSPEGSREHIVEILSDSDWKISPAALKKIFAILEKHAYEEGEYGGEKTNIHGDLV